MTRLQEVERDLALLRDAQQTPDTIERLRSLGAERSALTAAQASAQADGDAAVAEGATDAL